MIDHSTQDQTSPLVSIITPAYNCGLMIREAGESVLLQSHTNWEWWIVDDASTDDSWLHIQYLTKQDARIKGYRNEVQGGAAAARNGALAMAKGQYVAFLDADDWWHKSKLHKQLHALNRHPAVILCHTSVIRSYSKPCVWLKNWTYHRVKPAMKVTDIWGKNPIANSSVMVAVDRLQSKKLVVSDAPMRQDFLTWMALLSQNGAIAQGIDRPLTFIRIHKKSLSATKLRAAKHTWHALRTIYASRLKAMAAFIHYAIFGIWTSYISRLGFNDSRLEKLASLAPERVKKPD